MTLLELVASAMLALGTVFFFAGTVGLIRFPDLHSRLHALTKADNLGLGFVAIGLGLLSGSPVATVKLIAIWLLILIASSVSSHLIARNAWRRGARDLASLDP